MRPHSVVFGVLVVLALAAVTALPATATTSDEELIRAEMQGIDLVPPAEGTGQQAPPSASQKASRQPTDMLLIPESTNDRVMALDPATGDLIDADFIPSDPTNLATPIHAILSSGGNSILLSDQLNDVVHEYDLDGNYLGIFAPAGGPDTSILDNIRGMSLRANGNLLVTVGGGTNADSVAEFDTSGNYLGNFVANDSGGLVSPFDVLLTTEALVGGITSDAIHRYHLIDGSYLGNLAAINSFPEQLAQALNTNILVANFSGTQAGIMEFTSAGALVGIYTYAQTGLRGVYELPNNNLLITNGSGVHEVKRDGTVVRTIVGSVSGRFIERVTLAPTGADLQIVKTDGVDQVSYGDTVTYTIGVENGGPLDAPGATVTDSFPADLTGVVWTCTADGGGTCTAAGSGDISDTVDLPVGARLTYTAAGVFEGTSPGTLDNTATVTEPAGVPDPDPSNNSATDSDVIVGEVDLAITKTDGVTSVTPGEMVAYTMTATNVGPFDAVGATVADTFPAALTGVTWTCTASGFAVCTASGSGDIAETVDIPVGDSVTFVASGTVSAQIPDSLINTVTIDPAAGIDDPNLSNNTAEDIDTITGEVDLWVQNKSPECYYLAGDAITFTLHVYNPSAYDVGAEVHVQDLFHADLTGVSWTCSETGGVICPAASGSGNIDHTMSFPANSYLTYEVSATIDPGTTATWMSNTFTVTTPMGVVDPDPANNTATHLDAMEVPMFCAGQETGDLSEWSASVP